MRTSGRFVAKYERPKAGDVFGDWVVCEVLTKPTGGLHSVVCRCSCGEIGTPDIHALRSGRSTGCDVCAKRKSAMANTVYGFTEKHLRKRLLGCIANAIRRCTNPSCRTFDSYGGRGISVYPEWAADRSVFLQYLLTLPGCENATLTLDRIDNDKGYVPGNLRFVEARKQRHNKQCTRWVTYNGVRMSGTEFWEQHCPRYARVSTVLAKIRAGMPPEDIIDGQRGVRLNKHRP